MPTIMEYDMRKPSDEEVLKIVMKFQQGGYGTEEQDAEMIRYIERAYPEISDLIFWNKRNLTPEQILEEAKKKSNPIVI